MRSPRRTAASADDKVFIIGNYPVEARAADAVTAKERAIAEGQQAAFRSLLKRLVPVTAYGRLSELRDTKTSDLIAGFSVRSERNSTTEYIASYDFTFQADAVRNILEAEGIPFLDRQAEPLTLILAYRAPAGAEAPSEAFSDARGSDTWLYAWKALDLSNALTPITLKPLKKDTPPDAVQAVLDGDASAMRTLAADYQAGLVVVALLEPEAGGSRVRVTLAGQRCRRRIRACPQLPAQRWRSGLHLGGRLPSCRSALSRAAGRPSRRDPIQAVAVRARRLLRRRTGALRIAVEFNNMTQWQVISRQLAQTPDVSDLEVEGLSARGARLSLRYPGGPERLAAALAEYGLTLRAAGGGWVLTAR